MGWINNTVALVWGLGSRFAASDRPNEITTSHDLSRWLYGPTPTDAGMDVTIDTASSLAAVATSVRVISDSIAALPSQVLRLKPGGGHEEVPTHPVAILMGVRPNRWQTPTQFRKVVLRDILYRGNWYGLKIPGVSGIQQIIRLHPDGMTVKQDPDSLELTYCYRWNGMERDYPSSMISHLWFESDDGIVGINPIKAYRQSIGDGLAIRNHGSKFFSRAARMSGILKLPPGSQMGEEGAAALLSDFDSMYAGNTNAHRTAILPGGIDFEPVSISMEDAQWIEARKITAREIYGIYGVPPHKAGDLADATFSNVEHMNLGFVIDTMLPRLVALEQAWGRDLFRDDSHRLKFNVAALMRGDAKSRAESLQIMRRNGIINANEWRELEDMNPRADEGGSEYIVETNMRIQDGEEPDEPSSAV